MRIFGFLLIGFGLFLIAYLAGPMLLEGHILTMFLFAVPGGLVLGAGIGLVDDTPPRDPDQEPSSSSDPPRG